MNDQPSSQTRRGRYLNRYARPQHGGLDALRFIWKFWHTPWTPVAFPRAINDPARLRANRSEATLTWIGHASFLIQLDGLNILTDPVFAERCSPVQFAGPQRLAPPGLDFADLPPIDLVLISHNHYDHLCESTVRRLAAGHPDVHFIVPLGLQRWFSRRRIGNVIELDWWQAMQVGKARVHCVPVQHFSGRGPFDRDATLWCGYVLELAGRRIFFAGDTGYSKDFADIAARHPHIDLALLPIGAYDPRWFMAPVHVNPEEAVQIHRDLGAKLSVAMHWGTFRLTEEPLDEPPKRLLSALQAAGLDSADFVVMQHGETRKLPF